MFQTSLSDRQKMCWHVAGNAVSLFVEHRFFHLTTSYIFIPVSGGFLFILSLQCGNLPYIYNTFDCCESYMHSNTILVLFFRWIRRGDEIIAPATPHSSEGGEK